MSKFRTDAKVSQGWAPDVLRKKRGAGITAESPQARKERLAALRESARVSVESEGK